jgi:hypothetical protein
MMHIAENVINDLKHEIAASPIHDVTFITRSQLELIEVALSSARSEFNHGYVIACCNVTNLHDEPGIAHDTLRELGVTKAEVKRMGLCDYDAKALREIERARGPNSALYAPSTPNQE